MSLSNIESAASVSAVSRCRATATSSARRRGGVTSAKCCAVIRVASPTSRWKAICGTAPCRSRGTPRPRTKRSRSTRPSKLREAGEREAVRSQASRLKLASGPASTNLSSATPVCSESPWVSARCTTVSARRSAARTISSSTAIDGARIWRYRNSSTSKVASASGSRMVGASGNAQSTMARKAARSKARRPSQRVNSARCARRVWSRRA